MNTQMINFVIPKKLLSQVDYWGEKKSISRSELLREAVRRLLAEEAERERDFAIVRQSAARNNMNEEEAISLVDKIRRTLPRNK